MSKELLKRIQSTIARHQMLEPGDKVVVAVSGGSDSMALLTVLRRLQETYRVKLWIAHYDHRLRGEESTEAAAFVRTHAERLGIDFIAEADDGSLVLEQNNLEENARNRRYAFFQRVASEIGAQRVALGHTANDQAETFLLWAVRGAGTRGLGGIPPVRDDFFVRPLIESERSELRSLLKQEGIRWLDDSSNRDRDYLRNRIRHTLVPALQSGFAPDVVERLTQTTEIIREDERLLAALSEEAFQKMRRRGDGKEICLGLSELRECPRALKRRIIRHAVMETCGTLRRIHFAHVEAVIDIMNKPAPNLRISLPGGVEVLKEYQEVKFCRKEPDKVLFHYEFNTLPSEIRIPELNAIIAITVSQWNGNRPNHVARTRALMDFATLRFPLIVRPWKEGDRFQPLGMSGRKKVKDFFIDVKIPMRERHRIPIVLFDDSIAWVGGQRIDDRVKVTDITKKILEMDLQL